MTIFSTTAAAFKHVIRHIELNTGDELVLNGRIHFGVGLTPYVYNSDAEEIFGVFAPSKGCFTHLETDAQLIKAIEWTFKTDGYLAI